MATNLYEQLYVYAFHLQIPYSTIQVNNLYHMKKIIVWENIISSMNFIFRISQLSYRKQIQKSASNIFSCNWHNCTGISASLELSVNYYSIYGFTIYNTNQTFCAHKTFCNKRIENLVCSKALLFGKSYNQYFVKQTLAVVYLDVLIISTRQECTVQGQSVKGKCSLVLRCCCFCVNWNFN